MDPLKDLNAAVTAITEPRPPTLVWRTGERQQWVVSRHEDVVAVLAAPQATVRITPTEELMAAPGPFVEAIMAIGALVGGSMLHQDPPEHTRLRKLVVRAFSARRVDALRPRVQEITDALLDELARRPGPVDLVEHFAFELPITVICELVGAPVRDRKLFRDWSHAMTTLFVDLDNAPTYVALLKQMGEYLRELVETKRAEAAPDLLGDLAAVEVDGERLTTEEMVAMAALLIFAGHETTTNLIALGLRSLFTFPDQLDLLRARPELVPGAVDELLRYEGPITPGVNRGVTQDLAVGGTVIPAGSSVFCAVALANHDAAVFPDPKRLDVTRADASRHLGFGHGIHFCLGARLARLEGEIALGSILRRFPEMALAVPLDRLELRVSGLRALVDLPVHLS